MTVTVTKPDTTDELLVVAQAMTNFINFNDLSPHRNIVAYAFGPSSEGWEDKPAAWHRPVSHDVVINMGTLYKSYQTQFKNYAGEYGSRKFDKVGDLLVPTQEMINSVAEYINEHVDNTTRLYTTDKTDGKISTQPLSGFHDNVRSAYEDNRSRYYYYGIQEDFDPVTAIAKRILGIVLHETGHSVFSRFILEDWFQALDPYSMKIITMLEELRCEAQQLVRVGSGRTYIRHAADTVVDPEQLAKDIDDSRTNDGSISIAGLALNSTLTLGRTHYKVFLNHEVKRLHQLVTSVVGADRIGKMHEIWDRYVKIYDTDPAAMTRCAEDWKAMFPSDEGITSNIAIVIRVKKGDMPTPGEDSESSEESDENGMKVIVIVEDDDGEDSEDGDSQPSGGEGMDADGLPEMVESAAQEANDKAKDAPDDSDHEYGSRDLTPKHAAMSSATDVSDPTSRHARHEEPPAKIKALSKKLARELENLSVMGRDRFTVASEAPPGRLRPRAAVQRAAERSSGVEPTAKQWKRTKTVVDVNPPLTVGIMTDISGSQGWAEDFSAQTAWILARAVSEVNGRVAAVTFGESVKITLRPGAHPKKLTTVSASDGHERFDPAASALDSMLNLTTSRGVRLLFVVSDGQYGYGTELKKAHAWVDLLYKNGCGVVWVTEHDRNERAGGWGSNLELCPPKAIHLQVKSREVSSDPTIAVNAVAGKIKEAISRARARQ